MGKPCIAPDKGGKEESSTEEQGVGNGDETRGEKEAYDDFVTSLEDIPVHVETGFMRDSSLPFEPTPRTSDDVVMNNNTVVELAPPKFS